MTTENDRLLERVTQGDTLQALNLLHAGTGEGDSRLALNRALYGPLSDEHGERIREAEQAHRERLAELAPAEKVAALYNLGCFALMQDDVLEARLRFDEVLELEPGHLMARHNLAYAHELMAEVDEARREYEAVLAAHPDCGLSRLNLAQLKLAEGDHEGGLADLEAMHGQDPANMGVLLYLCRGLLLRGGNADLQRVLELLSATAEADTFVDLQECRAYAQYLLGDLEAAERSFAHLLESSEDNLFALAGMIKVLGQRSDFDGLRPYAERYEALAANESIAALLAELRGEGE